MNGPVEQRMPGRTGYVLGALCVVLGVVGAIVWLVLSLRNLEDTVDAFVRIDAPAQGELRIDQTGGLTAYAEGQGEGTPTLVITAMDGTPVPVEYYSGDLTYDIGGRSGRAFVTFDIPVAATYRVEVTGTDTVAIGESIATPLVRSILGMFVIGGLGFLLGLILLIVTAVRRSRARRATAAAPVATGAGWTAPPGSQTGWAAPAPPAPAPPAPPAPVDAGWAVPPPPGGVAAPPLPERPPPPPPPPPGSPTGH